LADEKPIFACVPSQNGLFADFPHRHSAIFSWESIGPFTLAKFAKSLTKYGPFWVGWMLGFLSELMTISFTEKIEHLPAYRATTSHQQVLPDSGNATTQMQ
jgi:hypothetical protein